MHFSERTSRILLSPLTAIFQKAQALKARGVELLDFGAGEPDFPTPEHIKQAAVEALRQNFTKYTPTGGIPELKEAIVARHAQDFGSNYRPEECLVTVGGKQAIFEAISVTVNHGDEVILPAPYYPSFFDTIQYVGGKVVLVYPPEDEGFVLRASLIKAALTPKTRMIIVNSPCNPTGAVVPPEEMEQILALAERHNLLLLADECYCHFVYDGLKPFSLGVSGNRENLLLVGSMSKTYAMTGWRLGFALGSAKLLANMLTVQSHCTSNPVSFVQKAAIAGLAGPQDAVEEMRAAFQARRDQVLTGLRAIPGIHCAHPQGAFYVYPNVRAFLGRGGIADTVALAGRLLEEAGVVVVPGPAFGTDCHIRLAYTTTAEKIGAGLQQLSDVFARLSCCYG
jgi:aspartate aminotransferase